MQKMHKCLFFKLKLQLCRCKSSQEDLHMEEYSLHIMVYIICIVRAVSINIQPSPHYKYRERWMKNVLCISNRNIKGEEKRRYCETLFKRLTRNLIWFFFACADKVCKRCWYNKRCERKVKSKGQRINEQQNRWMVKTRGLRHEHTIKVRRVFKILIVLRVSNDSVYNTKKCSSHSVMLCYSTSKLMALCIILVFNICKLAFEKSRCNIGRF